MGHFHVMAVAFRFDSELNCDRIDLKLKTNEDEKKNWANEKINHVWKSTNLKDIVVGWGHFHGPMLTAARRYKSLVNRFVCNAGFCNTI